MFEQEQYEEQIKHKKEQIDALKYDITGISGLINLSLYKHNDRNVIPINLNNKNITYSFEFTWGEPTDNISIGLLFCKYYGTTGINEDKYALVDIKAKNKFVFVAYIAYNSNKTEFVYESCDSVLQLSDSDESSGMDPDVDSVTSSSISVNIYNNNINIKFGDETVKFDNKRVRALIKMAKYDDLCIFARVDVDQ
jgi:hypothetical protein